MQLILEFSGISHFSRGGAFFTRTLLESGPLAALTGSSDWRPAVLPFQSSSSAPEALELRVVLPAGGTVMLAPFELRQYQAHEDPLEAPTANLTFADIS